MGEETSPRVEAKSPEEKERAAPLLVPAKPQKRSALYPEPAQKKARAAEEVKSAPASPPPPVAAPATSSSPPEDTFDGVEELTKVHEQPAWAAVDEAVLVDFFMRR